ncbi:hypothetical protein AXF42_Ash015334 [Apostasia shenzhenica]|uniref:Uncharacterized protein n=1 Tax=Apostasia shenzhenica TaxID=1088818 RepID=A0A2I0ALW8_9ASPA|nr:hypothetical protein AXF42_Ash015334 [Apostasia shenzhenica]
MGLWEILVTASVPVLNVLLLTAVGSIYATDHVGILSHGARKHLNSVVFHIFNPALVASNLALTFSLESMMLLWFMPINLALSSIIGSAFGWLLIHITKSPSHLRAVILACCSAGNIGNLFLVLVPAICKEKGSPLQNLDVCRTYGMAYASLSMAIGTILQWSYTYNIVRISSNYKESQENCSSNGTIPSLILITGGNLIKGFNGPGIPFPIIIGVIAIRFIALPIVGTILVEFAVHSGFLHSDPLYHLILLLQNAVPPAMNIASMIQMVEVGEGELSVILLWSYVVASMGLTLWSMFFLWLIS